MEELIPKSAEIPNSDFVIIGGTGDLAYRKIFPALFWRYLAGQINNKFRIFSIARSLIEKETFSKKLRTFCKDSISSEIFSEEKWVKFLGIIELITFDILSKDNGNSLKEKINEITSSSRPLIFYLAISPNLFGEATKVLAKNKLNQHQSRLVVEKPLGYNILSAKKINSLLLEVFEEKQIYRIDHYFSIFKGYYFISFIVKGPDWEIF